MENVLFADYRLSKRVLIPNNVSCLWFAKPVQCPVGLEPAYRTY